MYSRRFALQAVDDGFCELARLDLGRAFHEAGEVVGDDLVGDGRFDRALDVAGRPLLPDYRESVDRLVRELLELA